MYRIQLTLYIFTCNSYKFYFNFLLAITSYRLVGCTKYQHKNYFIHVSRLSMIVRVNVHVVLNTTDISITYAVKSSSKTKWVVSCQLKVLNSGYWSARSMTRDVNNQRWIPHRLLQSTSVTVNNCQQLSSPIQGYTFTRTIILNLLIMTVTFHSFTKTISWIILLCCKVKINLIRDKILCLDY